MNDMTKAVCEIMDTLDKSIFYNITHHDNYSTIDIVSYNSFGSLNYAMSNAGLGTVTFPYEVKLTLTIDKKFATLIEKEIEEYKGSLQNYHNKIVASYTNVKSGTCKCSTQQLMIKGCTCGGK